MISLGGGYGCREALSGFGLMARDFDADMRCRRHRSLLSAYVSRVGRFTRHIYYWRSHFAASAEPMFRHHAAAATPRRVDSRDGFRISRLPPRPAMRAIAATPLATLATLLYRLSLPPRRAAGRRGNFERIRRATMGAMLALRRHDCRRPAAEMMATGGAPESAR